MPNDKKLRSNGNKSRVRTRPKKSHLHSRKKSTTIATNQDNGLMTKVWGPAGWVFLHSCAMGYPVKIDTKNKEHKKRKRETKKFFESIGHVFPCRYCRDSYIRFIKELPITKHLDTRQSLCRWLYRIHNKVNKKLGIPKCEIPSLIDVNKRYETYRAKCHKTTKTEAADRVEKGCVVPQDGIRKRCIIKIINTKR